MLQVTAAEAGVSRGRLYVRIALQFAGFPVTRLASGYVTDDKALTWPPGWHEGSTDGAGRLYNYENPQPAAGARHEFKVPTNVRWRLRNVIVVLITSATVADRRVWLDILDGTAAVYTLWINTTQPASETWSYYWMVGYPEVTLRIGVTVMDHLPTDMLLFQGLTVRISAAGMQADDQFSVAYFGVEEWIEE